MATTRATLKQYFKKYATPTEAQFYELIDAFVHKDEDSLTQSKIDGLVQALNEKVTTNDVNTLVENKVTEIVSDPQFATAPTAHSHVADDVEGLSAFITRVTNFLDSADVSDTTINRWKEIETFLTGITDQETLTGLLLQLKNEITALIPEPASTNYLKQISDLDAYTDAQEGEIVQYVGSTTENYRRGFCYERVAGETYPQEVEALELCGTLTAYGRSLTYSRSEIDPDDNFDISLITDRIFLRDGSLTLPMTGMILLYMGDKTSPEIGDTIMPRSMFDGDAFRKVTSIGDGISANGIEFDSTSTIPIFINGDGIKIWSLFNFTNTNIVLNSNNIAIGVLLPDGRAYYVEVEKGVHYPTYNKPQKLSWQPIATSPVVS